MDNGSAHAQAPAPAPAPAGSSPSSPPPQRSTALVSAPISTPAPLAPTLILDAASEEQLRQIDIQPRPKITRSRLGCLSCRKRKKSCDLEKPACGACARLKLTCEWPVITVTSEGPPIKRNRKRSETSLSRATTSPTSTRHPHLNHGVAASSYPAFGSPPPPMAPPSTSLPMMGLSPGMPFEQVSLPPLQPPQPTMLNNQPAWPQHGSLITSRLDDFPNLLTDESPLDERLLELLAAGCFASFGSYSDDLAQPQMLSAIPHPSSPSVSSLRNDRPSSASSARTSSILAYYSKSLTALVSCTGADGPSGFDAFAQLASPSADTDRGEAARALHVAILAWSGRHLTNQGQFKYESSSETYGAQAMAMVEGLLAKRNMPGARPEDETQQITLLASALMVMQYKICRGDVWGYRDLVGHLRELGRSLFTVNPAKSLPGSLAFHFFENLLYHDCLSTFILREEPMIPYSVLAAYGRLVPSLVHTLTGLSLPLFSIMHRVAIMIRARLSITVTDGPSGGWSDDGLLDITRDAEGVEEDLRSEKRYMDELVLAQPHLMPHRYLHEAYRVACLLQLRSGVLCQRPNALTIKILVRQALSLLETMGEERLPGRCSAHWVLFCAGLCATGQGQEPGKDNDRGRVRTLYADFGKDMAFANIQRSLKVVEEVWRRYDRGGAWVDWLDVVADFDWELFIV